VLRAFLELVRPPNIATALGDVLAGFAVANLANGARLPWLLAASACLYAGGVVLNDVFDRHLDARERPERPLPSGRVRTRDAAALGAGLLAAGVAAAAVARPASGLVAVGLAAAVLIYDGVAKPWAVLGPLTMGACRGLNLALGMTAGSGVLADAWALCLIPAAYIAGITLLSRGEVTGARGSGPAVAAAVVGAAIAALGVATGAQRHAAVGLLLTALLAVRVLPPLARAVRTPSAEAIRRAVRAGVLSLILLDAALAASFAGLGFGLVLLAAAFAASQLARSFAVT
jgi:4-hydroxybenzoate polyprenyltransferase